MMSENSTFFAGIFVRILGEETFKTDTSFFATLQYFVELINSVNKYK